MDRQTDRQTDRQIDRAMSSIMIYTVVMATVYPNMGSLLEATSTAMKVKKDQCHLEHGKVCK